MFWLARPSIAWVLVLTGALALRVVAALVLQAYVDRTPGRLCLIEGDAEGYWELGGRLARCEEYSLYQPPRRILRMPGFPLLLAACRLVGGDRPLVARLVLAVVGMLACGAVGWLGTVLFDRRVGLWAAGLAAVSPVLILWSVMLLSETLFALCLLLSLVGLARLAQYAARKVSLTHEMGWALAAGLTIGLATLVRPTWLLVGPGMALLDVLRSRASARAWLRAACLLLALSATLLPWTIRNAAVSGHFVPTTLWVGPSLHDGLHVGATGASDMEFIERDRIYERLSEYDADQHYRREAWRFVSEHPRRALELACIKFIRYWSPVSNAGQFGGIGPNLLLTAMYVLTFVPAAWGLWRAWRQPASLPFFSWFLPIAPLAYLGAIHLVFIGSVRYRLPAEYPVLVLTAVGVRDLWGRAAGWHGLKH